MNKSLVIAVFLLSSTVASFPVLTQAREDVARSVQSAPISAPVREVSMRDLMTLTERFEMWRKMRTTRTQEERSQLWAQKYAELQKRAAARGLVLREFGPPRGVPGASGPACAEMSMHPPLAK